MPTNANVKLVKKEQLKEDIFKFTCESKEISNNAKPGQFVEIKISESYEPFLRRPISIYNVNKQDNLFEIIFQVKGRGTNFLSKLEEGDFIDVVGPLGNGIFKLNGHKNVAIIGGGIGIFPLYEFVKEAQKEANTNIYLGFRSKDFVVLELFSLKIGAIYISAKCITSSGEYDLLRLLENNSVAFSKDPPC